MVFSWGWTPSSAKTYQPDSFITENDIVIAVMGPTGVGKSSFINKVAGRPEAVVGNSLTSQTRKVHPVRCQRPDGTRNIVLVDTPGFDHTHLSDPQVLETIVDWLKETYQNNIKLAGLLYLHRISDGRIAGTHLRNLSIFKDLCGAGNMKNVVLVTMMWDDVEEDKSAGEKREKQLVSDLWKDIISLGSHTRRFEGTLQSAWGILDCLDLKAHPHKLTPLQIQAEMVDRRLPFHETAAARTFLRSIAAELKKASANIHSGSHQGRSSKKLANNRSRNIFLSSPPSRSQSSEARSVSSLSSWSVVSSTTETFSIVSLDSRHSSRSAGRCPDSCHHGVLSCISNTLRVALARADLASVSVLRGPIGTVLRTVQTIEGMSSIHHAIIQVVDCCAWLLCEISNFAAQTQLPNNVKKMISSFHRELNCLQNVVIKTSKRVDDDRFSLLDADIQVIVACVPPMKQLQAKLAIDDHRAITLLENGLTELHDRPASVFLCPGAIDSTSKYQHGLCGCIPLGRDTNGRRNTLPAMITALKLTHEMAGITSIPVLQGSIQAVLHTAEHIEKIGGTHHTIIQVLECSTLLVEGIALYTVESRLSKDVKDSLSSLQSQLNDLQNVVEAISSRNPAAPFFMQDADIRVITLCITSIKQVYDQPELKISLFDRQATTYLNNQLSGLTNNSISRRCECGISVVHEED